MYCNHFTKILTRLEYSKNQCFIILIMPFMVWVTALYDQLRISNDSIGKGIQLVLIREQEVIINL